MSKQCGLRKAVWYQKTERETVNRKQTETICQSSVVSENKRFLFTRPNGCEHFLNIAHSGGCIRKVKGLAGILMTEIF